MPIFWWDLGAGGSGGGGGTSVDPGIGNVKKGVTYEINNVFLTGTYNPLGTGIGTGVAHLTEKTRTLIIAAIQANIVAELAAIRTDRNDPRVTVESPKQYFIYGGAHTYQCPAIFVVVDSGDVPDEQKMTNYVSAMMKVYVSAVVEGQIEASVTVACERYQSALFKILHQTVIQDTVDNVKIYVRCKRFQFSELYTKSRKGENMGDFRKEVALELEVQHWENPTS